MAYTFFELKADIRTMLWPNGAPDETHATVIDTLIVEGLIELQRWIPCLRQRHESVFEQCATYFKCGTTWIDRPPGIVSRVFTVWGTGHCNPVHYNSASPQEIECWSRSLFELVDQPVNAGLPLLPSGFKYSEDTTDSQYGRAMTGLWAIDGDRIVVAPWLQSDESLVVVWKGIKREWSDADPVSSDADFKRCLRLWVKWSWESEYGRDKDVQRTARGSFDEALADLKMECQHELDARSPERCCGEAEDLWRNWSATLDEETDESVEEAANAEVVVGIMGDYGRDNADEDDVATLVKGWGPDAIVTLGDNNYPDGAAGTIDDNIGKYYHEYIGDYSGAHGAGADDNKFWPCLGNHDLDTVESGIAGKPFFDYFTLPNNERWYDFVVGHVHFFCVNSGFNTAGDIVEPAGNDPASVQAEILRDRLAASTAKWKVVYFHHPPYTNNSSYSPGKVELRWPFKDWGADLVMSGHAHNYERLEVDGLPYIIAGTGGSPLVGFIAEPTDESQFRYSAEHGAVKMTANCDSLTCEFFNTEGTLIDTLEIT